MKPISYIARIRGFKSIEPALLRLLIMYHNFIRPHGGPDGRTPAEAAGMAVAGPDKWRIIIGHAALFCMYGMRVTPGSG